MAMVVWAVGMGRAFSRRSGYLTLREGMVMGWGTLEERWCTLPALHG